jgi:hypothetical protein
LRVRSKQNYDYEVKKMTKLNKKSIITGAAAVFAAIILSLSFILIVNGDVEKKPDTAPSYNVAYGESLTISAATIEGWFDFQVEYGSDYAIDENLDFSAMRIQLQSGSTSTDFQKENDGVTFTPTVADIGQTLVFTFTVQGSASGAASDGVSGNSDSIDVTINVTKPAYPQPSIEIDYAAETLTGFVSGGDYIINGNAYNNVTEPVAIISTWFETDLSIIHTGDDNHSNSPAHTLTIKARPTAPTLGKTDETSFGLFDGQITGLDTAKKYEYSSNGTTWTEYGPGIANITYLSPRTYYVRLAATSTDFASTATEKTIAAAPFVSALVLDSEKGLTYNGDEAIGKGVLASGSYTWNSGTKTLNLNGVNYTTAAQYALDLSAYNSDVHLVITGTNSFTSTYNGTLNTGGIISYGTLTVSGTGSLSATGGTGSASSAGLRIQARTLVVNSGTVTLTGGDSTNQSNGVYGSVIVNGGNVTILGDNQAIYSGTGTINAPAYNWTSSGPSPSGTYPGTALTIGTQTSISVTSLTGVTPTTYTFNKAVSSDTFEIDFSLAAGVTFNNIVKNGGAALTPTYDWVIDGNTIEITSSYLMGLDVGTYTITLDTTAATDPTVTLNVTNVYDKGLVLKSDGLYYNNTKLNGNDSKLGGGSYTYDAVKKILTLDDVNFTTSEERGLDLSEVADVKVRLSGDNSIASTASAAQSTGVFSNGSFTIEGTGSLTARSGNTAGNMSAGIGSSNGGITINGGTIEAIGGRSTQGSGFSNGIVADGDIKITAGSVTAKAGTAINSYGIESTSNKVIITGGTVTAEGEDNAFFGTLELPVAYKYTKTKGGGLTDSGTTALSSIGTYAYIETVTGVTPTTATFDKADPEDIVLTYSLASGITLSDVLIDNVSCAKTIVGNVITIDDTVLDDLTLGTHTIKLDVSSGTDPTVAITVTRIFDEPLKLNATTNKLEYNDIEATQEILGGGSYSYNSSTKTLTLTNVNFTTEAAKGLDLSNVQYVTLNLIGANSITATGTGDKYAIYSDQSFSIDGAGSLTATSGVGTTDSNAISSLGSITINGGTITATAGTASYSFGIFANDNIDINGGEITAIGVTKAFNTAPILPAAYEWETEDDDGEYPFDAFVYNDEEEVYIKTVPLQTRIYSTDLTFDKVTPNDVDMEYTLASGVTLQGVQIDGNTVTYDSSTPNLVVIDDADIASRSLSLGNHTIRLVTSGADPTVTLTVTAVYADYLTYSDGAIKFQSAPMTKNNEKFGGGSYDYNDDTNTLTLTNTNYTNNDSAALNIDSEVTVSVVGTNVWRTVSTYGTPSAIGGNEPLVLDGTGSLTAEATSGKAFSREPTILMDNYTWEAIDSSGVRTTGTNNYVYSATHRKVTIAYKASDPVPEPPAPDLGEPDIAPPPKEDIYPVRPLPEKDPDDNKNEEANTNLKVNGEMADTAVAMPVEPGDKTADVKIDGKTVETYSLTAAEAIADGNVVEAFVSASGAIAAVTTGGNVIAGGNATGSLNSATTIEALEAAAEAALSAIAEAEAAEGESVPTDSDVAGAAPPLITINAGQEVTGISDNTLEKIIATQNEYGVDTQIQKTQYSVDENEQIDELIYRITIPVTSENVRDIRLGAEFSTKIVEASIAAFEKTFGNTDCAGFALTQKDTFGVEATIQVKMSAIGFTAEPGDTVYIAIFDPKTGEFIQVEGIVGEDGFIKFVTDKSGIIVISASPFIF